MSQLVINILDKALKSKGQSLKKTNEYIEELTNKIYDEYMVKDNTNTTDKEFSSNNSNNSNNNNFERELYIREMCKTQIALFRELEDKINQINKSEE